MNYNFMVRHPLSYSLLNASIGFRFAAFTDGNNPNTRPITIENNTEPTIAEILIAVGVLEI